MEIVLVIFKDKERVKGNIEYIVFIFFLYLVEGC